MDIPSMMCPTCGSIREDQRFDKQGFPKVGQVWLRPADDFGPEHKLYVDAIHKTDLNGREIVGRIIMPPKNKEAPDSNSRPYSTNLENFHKTWVYNGELIGEAKS